MTRGTGRLWERSFPRKRKACERMCATPPSWRTAQHLPSLCYLTDLKVSESWLIKEKVDLCNTNQNNFSLWVQNSVTCTTTACWRLYVSSLFRVKAGSLLASRIHEFITAPATRAAAFQRTWINCRKTEIVFEQVSPTKQKYAHYLRR